QLEVGRYWVFVALGWRYWLIILEGSQGTLLILGTPGCNQLVCRSTGNTCTRIGQITDFNTQIVITGLFLALVGVGMKLTMSQTTIATISVSKYVDHGLALFFGLKDDRVFWINLCQQALTLRLDIRVFKAG